MKRIFTLICLMVFTFPSTGKTVKCEDEHGRITFSDKPCLSNQKATNIDLKGVKDNSNVENERISIISGNILEPKGMTSIKDAVGTKNINDNGILIELDLYHFLLSNKNYQTALKGLVGREGILPRKIKFEFSSSQLLSLKKDNLLSISYIHYGMDNSKFNERIGQKQAYELIKNIKIFKKNSKTYFEFKMLGNSTNYHWDLNMQALLNDYESDSIETSDLVKKNSIQDGNFYSIEGIVTYNDTPIHSITSLEANFSVKEKTTNKYIKEYDIQYDKKTSKYVIRNLPNSNYTIIVHYSKDKSRGTATKPGDYIGHIDLNLNSNLVDKNIRLNGVIHLIKPIDNLSDQPGPFKSKTFSSPLTFKWVPILNDAKYEYRLRPTSESSKAKFQKLSEITKETQVTLELPKGKYSFDIIAKDNTGQRIAYLIMSGKSWSATDYSFSIK